MKLKFPVALALATLALAACSHRGDVPMSSNIGDDDAFCRANNVQAGSAEYVACRKDRDIQRGNAAARADDKQRGLAEYMLNNPTH